MENLALKYAVSHMLTSVPLSTILVFKKGNLLLCYRLLCYRSCSVIVLSNQDCIISRQSVLCLGLSCYKLNDLKLYDFKIECFML